MAKTSNKLTAAQLKKLEVGQSAYGSNLRVTKNKSGLTFHACFAIDGERYLHKVGTDEATNLTDAVKAASHFRAVKEREHELKRDGGAESDITLAEAVPMYLQHLLLHQGKNYKKKEQHFREHILPKLGHLKLKHLRTQAVDQFRVHLRTEKELSHSTVNRTISTLNHLYRHAGEQEWLKVKPFKIQKYMENYHGRDRIWPDEKQAMLSTARQVGQHRMLYLFVLIGFGTGMRHREILMMQWQRINWKNCTVHLREAKSGPRHQPLPTTVLAELRSLYDSLVNKQGFVFSANTKTGHINDMSRQFKKLCKDAGLQNVYTPHYMRHTRVTELVEAGFPDNVIKEITGHKTNVMIAHYSHLRGSTAVRTAVDHCDLQAAYSGTCAQPFRQHSPTCSGVFAHQ